MRGMRESVLTAGLLLLTSPARAEGSLATLSFLEILPVWLQWVLVVFSWWLIALVLSHIIWKRLDNPMLAARISMGLAALLMSIFVHYFVYEFSLICGVCVAFALVAFIVILWYSYTTASEPMEAEA